uniref:Uncharacterized protein n=1 Tax=Arundo donax TaxID=35708 RepID=A0A0A8YJ85_ARUDO
MQLGRSLRSVLHRAC